MGKNLHFKTIGFVAMCAALIITVSCDGMFTAEITQSAESIGVSGISVYPKQLEMALGESSNQLEARIVPANASNQLIIWESSDPSVATVDANGVVTAGYASGVAVVVASSADGEHLLDSAVLVVGEDLIGKQGPAGGLIFYEDVDDNHPWRFLEAAPAGWHDGGQQGPSSVWSNVTNASVGTTSASIGAGLANTLAIIAQEGHEESAANTAAVFSLERYGVIYADWFLPSRGELAEMYTNLRVQGLGGFEQTKWASSETSGNLAHAQQFGNGTLRSDPKGIDRRLRPIRAF